MPVNAPALLTELEAAASLQVCERTMRNLRRSGKIRYVKVGRSVRYAPDDITAYIDAARTIVTQKRKPPSPKPQSQRTGEIIPFSQRA